MAETNCLTGREYGSRELDMNAALAAALLCKASQVAL